MPDTRIMTHGINLFHNAESFRCEVVIATNPGITILATRAYKVVYSIKYKSNASYVYRDPRNPWSSEEDKPDDPHGMIILSIEL